MTYGKPAYFYIYSFICGQYRQDAHMPRLLLVSSGLEPPRVPCRVQWCLAASPRVPFPEKGLFLFPGEPAFDAWVNRTVDVG